MFSEIFIKRPILASVCSLVIILLGVLAIFQLPVEEYPDIAPPQVAVNAIYPGATAEVVEATVTTPLELQINGSEGSKYITSTSSSNGSSTVTAYYDLEQDVDQAVVDVQNRIKAAEGRLPDEVKRDGITVKKVSNNFVLIVGFGSPDASLNTPFISNYVDRYVRESLQRIDGVGDIRMFGERKYAIRVWLNPEKLAALGLSSTDVLKSLREQNLQVAAGIIGQPPAGEEQTYQFNVRAESRLKSQADFENIVVFRNASSGLVKLREVARIELGAEDYSSLVRYKGRETVGMLINQLPKANSLQVARDLKAELARLSKEFPPGMVYFVALDPTKVIEESINELVITLFQAVGLVVLVILFFLQSWRSTLIPALAIPVSLLGTFLFVKLLGFSINTLTLFGLTLATGLVVDDAIIVVENIMRFIEEKKMSAMEASTEAMKEVYGPIIATSLVLIAVFVPVALFPGTTGKLYQQFALTIAFSIAISTFNSLTLTPALCAFFLTEKTGLKEAWIFERFNFYLDKFRRFSDWSIGKAAQNIGLMMLVFVGMLVGMVFAYRALPTAFVPAEDKGYFIISLQAPEGSSLAHTASIASRVEDILAKEKNIAGYFSVSGFSFLGPAPNRAMIFPQFTPIEERKADSKNSSSSIVGRLRGQLMGIPGAVIVPIEPPAIRGLGTFGGVQFELLAKGADVTLSDLAGKAFELIGASSQTQELRGLFTGYSASDPQLSVQVNRDLAKSLGIPIDYLYQTLQLYLSAYYVNDFNFENRQYRVYLQADQRFRDQPEDLARFYVFSDTGAAVPLSSLVTVKTVLAPQNIFHFNLFRSAEINGSAAPGFTSGQAIARFQQLAESSLSQGFSYAWAGLSREELEAGNAAAILFVLGLLFVFLVLAAQYESLVDPLIILLSVPLALLGALCAQLVRGLQVDIFCQVGILMLVGLASKNAILIVEFANQLRRSGLSAPEAVQKAVSIRLRPILMTSLAFILGILPLVFATGAGSASKISLGTTVFGGMLFATFLSLVFVPVIYIFINQLRERVRPKKKAESTVGHENH